MAIRPARDWLMASEGPNRGPALDPCGCFHAPISTRLTSVSSDPHHTPRKTAIALLDSTRLHS